MQKALDAAPWLAPFAFITLLLRREIGALLLSGRGDAALEKLMADQVEMFRKNLEYFATVAGHTSAMQASLAAIERNSSELVQVQRRVEVEVVRQGGHP